MKLKLLAMLIPMAFGSNVMGVAPEGGGKAEEAAKVASWAEKGKEAGAKIKDALSSGEKIHRDVLFETAEQIAGQPAAEDWLTGFASAWSDPATAKVRKSEAKTFFTAYAMPNAIEQIVKLDDKGQPVKETKMAKDWLKGHDGSIHQLFTLARRLKGLDGSTATATHASTVKVLTAKGATDVMERLKGANPSQLYNVAMEAIKRLPGAVGFEIIITDLIAQSANILKAKTQDEAFIKLGADVSEAASSLVERARGAIAANKTLTAAVTASKGIVPAATAEKPKDEAEVVETPAPAQATGTTG